jgi:DNA-binding transcriptional regulator GbsR (MarR family)
MDAERLQFVEDFGVVFERSGSTRMLGRVLGLLMVSDPPEQTAEQLATTLHASRGSISQATRALIDIGLVTRSRKPGTRLDVFAVKGNAWIETYRRGMQQVQAYHDLFDRGLDLMRDQSEESRQALEQAKAFMEFWAEQMPLFFEKWNQRTRDNEPLEQES